MLARGVGGVDRICRRAVARFNPSRILQVDVEVRKDESLADILPDDAGHLVPVISTTESSP